MSNLIQNTTGLAMAIAGSYIRTGSFVVDATCGNGHDTLELAKRIFTGGLGSKTGEAATKLFAFDIQKAAVENTKARLIDSGFGPQLDEGLICVALASHEAMSSNEDIQRLTESGTKACLIVFNLGYLPGGDKTITTKPDSTLKAVKDSLDILEKDGLICITMYSGHEAGAKEKQALLAFAEELDSRKFHVSYISMINQPADPPEILLISRKN